MITYYLFNDGHKNDLVETFFAVISSMFTIPLDILLMPFEIIAFIIYKLDN